MLISNQSQRIFISEEVSKQPEVCGLMIGEFIFKHLHDWNLKDTVTVTFIHKGILPDEQRGNLIAIEVILAKETGDPDYYTDEEIEQINRNMERKVQK